MKYSKVQMAGFLVLLCSLALSDSVFAGCPKGYYRDGLFGVCLPKVGGDVGKIAEKAKKETKNFFKDAEVLIKTGECGGDICDALGATAEFGVATLEDADQSFSRAAERLREGKPIDALWHIATDSMNDAQENTADAAQKSSLLRATGQVAASVYGGPQGAAAYTAWLTYHYTDGDLGSALKAGMVAGASALALGEVGEVGSTYHADLRAVEQVAVKSILTGAVNGVAVGLAGGTQDDVQAAFGMGIATVLIREGYRELSSFDLDNQRLRSSTGTAYCLQEPPPPEYFLKSGASGCFAPQKAYRRNPDGSAWADAHGNPEVDLKSLDPNRPHLGMASGRSEPFIGAGERSAVMTGVSRLPGWNAMSVGHDQLAADLKIDFLPVDVLTNQGTIATAVVLTYVGTGDYIHEMIREAVVESRAQDSAAEESNGAEVERSLETGNGSYGTEVTHIVCQDRDREASTPRAAPFDLLIKTAINGTLDGKKTKRICEIEQIVNGDWHPIGHSHNQKNYCHTVAERVARLWMSRGYVCEISVGAE